MIDNGGTVSSVIRQIVRKIPPLRKLYYAHVGAAVLANTVAAADKLKAQGFNFDAEPARSDATANSFGLQALGKQYLPTKRLMNYLMRYDHVFGAIRHDVKRMVEIGADRHVRSDVARLFSECRNNWYRH
jgi:hypothetical protein